MKQYILQFETAAPLSKIDTLATTFLESLSPDHVDASLFDTSESDALLEWENVGE